jgi:chromosome segregation ATPase
VGLGKTAGAIETIRLKLKSLDELSARLNGHVREGEPLARSREAERELVQTKEEAAIEEEQEQQREVLFRQEEGQLQGEISQTEADLRKLQGKLAVYGAAGSPALFAKEIKALEEERDQKEAKAQELQHALRELRSRREVAVLEHRDRLRKLQARQEKLSGEVEVRANFSGQVLGMEAHHEADHVRVDLTVAADGQGDR